MITKRDGLDTAASASNPITRKDIHLSDDYITISVEKYSELVSKATVLDIIKDLAQDEDFEYRLADFCRFLARGKKK